CTITTVGFARRLGREGLEINCHRLGDEPRLVGQRHAAAARLLALNAALSPFPSPLWGGVRGGGPSRCVERATRTTPLPNPPPHPSHTRGEGAHQLCVSDVGIHLHQRG